MRLLLLAAMLLAPLAAAEPAPTLRQCTSASCVIVSDQDGDGEYDWANAAFIAGEQVAVNANANGSLVLFEAIVTTEELGGQEAEELTGLEAHHTVALVGIANVTDGVREADAFVFVGEGNHETGEIDAIYTQYVVARDTDGDGLPETVEAIPPLA